MAQIGGLLVIVLLIIVATTKLKLHPFLVLLLAAVLTGLLGGLDADAVLHHVTEGFGGTLKSIGIVIACGAIIGVFLERSGGASRIADAALQCVGERRAPLAMNVTGYLVSIPVFCDSGFILLAAVNKALSKRTGIPLTVLAVALATGLYATHVFVPPTPGPLAAAATLDADIGLVLMLGLLVAVPVALAGVTWATLFCGTGQRLASPATTEEMQASPPPTRQSASTPMAFAVLLAPLLLIALKSVGDSPLAPFGTGKWKEAVSFFGHPVIALLIGALLAFRLKRADADESALNWVTLALKDAGVIILITGSGGAFGDVLRASGIGDAIAEQLADYQLGMLLPFVIAAALKTAQGSSTVAIITTAALISPLMETMGFTAAIAKALVVLAIGAGAMTVSHVNDSYFWVVSQFSDMDTGTALRSLTVATAIQGCTAIAAVSMMAAVFVH